jgi:hypothetical protein
MAIILLFGQNENTGDEVRYLWYADNILNGFYSPPPPDIVLWNGPGYPIFITPLVLLDLPIFAIRLANAFLLYFSLIIAYQTFRYFIKKEKSLIYASLVGLYYPIFEMLPLVYSECLAWFLMSVVCFFFIRIFKEEKHPTKYVLYSALSLAFLAMTKVIFGHVILGMILISLLFLVFPGFYRTAKRSLLIFSLALVFCVPYLYYTYHLTKKPFYWTNSASVSLYTMSSPYPGELGDWSNLEELTRNFRHADFIDSIKHLSTLEQDEAFKSQALKNIRNHPKKYFMNWLANIGRLFFSYPFSKTSQSLDTYFAMLPNMFFIVCITFSLFIGIIQIKRVPHEILLLLIFILIYLAGSSIVSAYRRMFYITVPFWFLFIAYTFNHLLLVRIKSE